MNLSSIFGFKKPEATDNAVAYSDISANADLSEKVSKNGIAIQTNTSTTAYTSDFPLSAYVDGHSFVFIPLYTCTGAVTINFNSLGVKKVFNELGTVQASNGAYFEKAIQYLLVYDSSIDGGLGAFKSIRLSPDRFVGEVFLHGGSTPPLGALHANGAAVSRTTYARLFAEIGTAWGSGDGSTTFNLPDGRGEFFRGLDGGRGIDTGRVLGSFQNGTAFAQSNFNASYISDGEADGTVSANSSGASGTDTFTKYRARVRNIALLPCIKY